MQSKATKKAAPSPTEAASKTNEQNHTPPARRGASPGRREKRRGWRPARIGELIEAAMIGIKGAEAAP